MFEMLNWLFTLDQNPEEHHYRHHREDFKFHMLIHSFNWKLIVLGGISQGAVTPIITAATP